LEKQVLLVQRRGRSGGGMTFEALFKEKKVLFKKGGERVSGREDE